MRVILQIKEGNDTLFSNLEKNKIFSAIKKEGKKITACFSEPDSENKYHLPSDLFNFFYGGLKFFIDVSTEQKDGKVVCDHHGRVLNLKKTFFESKSFKFKVVDDFNSRSFVIIDYKNELLTIKGFLFTHQFSSYIQMKEKVVWEGNLENLPVQYERFGDLIQKKIKKERNNGI